MGREVKSTEPVTYLPLTDADRVECERREMLPVGKPIVEVLTRGNRRT